MAHKGEGNRFVVDLGDAKLSREFSTALEYAIQRAALDVLARVDLEGELVVRFPWEWVGLIVDYRGDFDNLREGLGGQFLRY